MMIEICLASPGTAHRITSLFLPSCATQLHHATRSSETGYGKPRSSEAGSLLPFVQTILRMTILPVEGVRDEVGESSLDSCDDSHVFISHCRWRRRTPSWRLTTDLALDDVCWDP